MNSISLLVSSSWLAALGWALVHFLWQGSAIAGALALALRWGRHQSANVRHRLACAALFVMLLALGLTIIWSAAGGTPPAPLGPAKAVLAQDSSASVASTTPAASITLSSEWLTGLTLVWGAGVLLFGLRLVGGWWQTQRLVSRDVSPAPAEWQERLEDLKARLHLRQPIRLFESLRIHSPVLVGWLRPVILLPVGLVTGLTPAQVDAILVHELAHIHGRDYLINWVQHIAETLLFYHPAVWWVSDQIRREREHRCDDWVVTVLGDGRGLAAALLTLAERAEPIPELALAADGGSVAGRVRRLLGATDPTSPATRRPWRWILAGLALALIALSVWLLPALTAPRLFQSTARIKIEPKPTTVGGIVSDDRYDPYFLQTQLALLRSASILSPVVDQLGLAKRWNLPSPGAALVHLRDRVRVQQYRNTSIIEITAASENDKEAAVLANAIASQFAEIPIRLADERRAREQDYRSSRMHQIERKLEDASTRLEEFDLSNAEALKRREPTPLRRREELADEVGVLREIKLQRLRESVTRELDQPVLEPATVEIIDSAEPGLRPARWQSHKYAGVSDAVVTR